MGQRFSGYDRKDGDAYQTPSWVTATIVPHLRALGVTTVWDPACGDGLIVKAFRDHGFDAMGTDITAGNDFLNGCIAPATCDALVTTPLMGQAAVSQIMGLPVRPLIFGTKLLKSHGIDAFSMSQISRFPFIIPVCFQRLPLSEASPRDMSATEQF